VGKKEKPGPIELAVFHFGGEGPSGLTPGRRKKKPGDISTRKKKRKGRTGSSELSGNFRRKKPENRKRKKKKDNDSPLERSGQGDGDFSQKPKKKLVLRPPVLNLMKNGRRCRTSGEKLPPVFRGERKKIPCCLARRKGKDRIREKAAGREKKKRQVALLFKTKE